MTAPQPHPLAHAELIVITCGSRKLDHRAPAGELYTGAYHRACRRAADALEPERLLILSSAHGLVGVEDVIDPYDTPMGAAGSVSGAQLTAQARERGVLELDPVIVLAGRRHLQLAQAVWPHAVGPLTGIGGMGHQISYLTALARNLG
jgi:hypothetical protein